MNRREFLSLLSAGAAGLAMDPERLLWRKGAKTFFYPTPTLPPDWSLNASGLLVRGDVFTINGFYAKNPVTGLNTPHLQMFVVTQDVTSSTINVAEVHPRIMPPVGAFGRALARPVGVWH